MTQDEIIEITRQVGGFDATPEFLAKFANAVAQHEREACAKICEEEYDTGLLMAPASPSLAAAIRARGNT